MENEIAVPFEKSMSHPSALATKKYGVTTKELLKANIDREILLMKRNSFFYMFRVVQLILLSVIEMTLFFHTEMHRDSVANGGIYMGISSSILLGLTLYHHGFSRSQSHSLRLVGLFS